MMSDDKKKPDCEIVMPISGIDDCSEEHCQEVQVILFDAIREAGFSMPCIPIQRTKASNQPVLVVSFGYMPKPCPPCSYRWNSTGRFAALQLSISPVPPLPNKGSSAASATNMGGASAGTVTGASG